MAHARLARHSCPGAVRGGSVLEKNERALDALLRKGRVPVFPLPDMTFFPHTSLALHIFEPRYRLMTRDALRTDRLIAMAALKPGWENGYHRNPEVFSIGCVGLIEEEVQLPGGRFNIRLRGICRVEFGAESREMPYRVMAARVLPDLNDQDGPAVEDDKHRLLAACAGLLQEVSGLSAFPVVLDNEVPFAAMVNTLCQNLVLEPSEKRRLLEMDDMLERCRALSDLLDRRWKEIALAGTTGTDGAGGDVH